MPQTKEDSELTIKILAPLNAIFQFKTALSPSPNLHAVRHLHQLKKPILTEFPHSFPPHI